MSLLTHQPFSSPLCTAAHGRAASQTFHGVLSWDDGVGLAVEKLAYLVESGHASDQGLVSAGLLGGDLLRLEVVDALSWQVARAVLTTLLLVECSGSLSCDGFHRLD